MVERIAPTLASIGNHKNGTWAAQRLIECATTPEEIQVISEHLRPFVPALMADGVGNYVVSGWYAET
jgi:protein JSN1